MTTVWRAGPVDPERLESADRVFSELLCDPDRIGNLKYHVLDELSQRSSFLRSMTEEERQNYWQNEDGHKVPTDYKHYKSRPVAPEDDTELTNEMFERG